MHSCQLPPQKNFSFEVCARQKMTTILFFHENPIVLITNYWKNSKAIALCDRERNSYSFIGPYIKRGGCRKQGIANYSGSYWRGLASSETSHYCTQKVNILDILTYCVLFVRSCSLHSPYETIIIISERNEMRKKMKAGHVRITSSYCFHLSRLSWHLLFGKKLASGWPLSLMNMEPLDVQLMAMHLRIHSSDQQLLEWWCLLSQSHWLRYYQIQSIYLEIDRFS